MEDLMGFSDSESEEEEPQEVQEASVSAEPDPAPVSAGSASYSSRSRPRKRQRSNPQDPMEAAMLAKVRGMFEANGIPGDPEEDEDEDEDDEGEEEAEEKVPALELPQPDFRAGAAGSENGAEGEDDCHYVTLDSLQHSHEDDVERRVRAGLPAQLTTEQKEDREAREHGVTFCFLCWVNRQGGTALRGNVFVEDLERFKMDLGTYSKHTIALNIKRHYNRYIRNKLPEEAGTGVHLVWTVDMIIEHMFIHEPSQLSDALQNAHRLRNLVDVLSKRVVMRQGLGGEMAVDGANFKMLMTCMKAQKDAVKEAVELANSSGAYRHLHGAGAGAANGQNRGTKRKK